MGKKAFEMIKRGCTALTALLLMLAFAVPQAGAESLRGYDKDKKGPRAERYQYILLGNYPYEANGEEKPVLWRVLSVKDGEALLLSEMILDTRQVIKCETERESEKRLFRRIADFAESDLCAWMNGEMLNTLLGEDPMRGALVETHYGYLYPPTDEQMLSRENGFTPARYGDETVGFPERRATATPYAKSVKLYPDWGPSLYVHYAYDASPYWSIGFRTDKWQECIMLSLCGYNGHMSFGVYSRTGVGVRPALTLNTALCTIASGSGTADDPFVMTYTGPAGE